MQDLGKIFYGACMIKVLVADDHPIWCKQIAALIDAEKDMRHLGSARTGKELIAMAKALLPDVIFLDIVFNDADVSKIRNGVAANSPVPKLIVLSSHVDPVSMKMVLKYGVAGCMSKRCEPEEISEAVRAVLVADAPVYMDRWLTETITFYASNFGTPAPFAPREREWEVLTLIALGADYREIARRLSIAESTVMSHRLNGMRRLNVTNDASLTRLLIRIGRISAEEEDVSLGLE
jgi:DNA-binding NarL/FixJ family response regulator